MESWKTIVDPSTPLGHASGATQFGITAEQLNDVDDQVIQVQRDFQNGETTPSEFTYSLLQLARTEGEAFYLTQISGAQIFTVMQHHPERFR